MILESMNLRYFLIEIFEVLKSLEALNAVIRADRLNVWGKLEVKASVVHQRSARPLGLNISCL